MWVNVHSEAGNMKRVEEILEMMKAAGVQPNVRTYTTIMKGHIARKDLEGAEGVLSSMEKDGVRPDTVAFNSLIHAFACKGNCVKAESFIPRMIEMGVKPDQLTFQFMRKKIRSLARSRWPPTPECNAGHDSDSDW